MATSTLLPGIKKCSAVNNTPELLMFTVFPPPASSALRFDNTL